MAAKARRAISVTSFPRFVMVFSTGPPDRSGTGRVRSLFRRQRPTAAMHLVGVRWMECEEVLIRLWEYLDQELGPEEAQSVGEHLYSCLSCRPAYQCDRAFLDLLARQRSFCRPPRSLILRMHTEVRSRT
jgi:hypothetical protein